MGQLTGSASSARWIACALLVAFASFVPSSYGFLASAAGDRGAYALGTLLLIALVGLLPWLWPRTIGEEPERLRLPAAAAVWLAGLALLGHVASSLLPTVFAGPLDPNRGDMLVIIEHAMTLFLQGGNPYAIHKVPWDAPLSYGPPLWMPFLVPHLLRVDLRVVTIACQIAIPAALFHASGLRAGQGHWPRAAALFGLGAAIAHNPTIMPFHAIGHTQIYWPLLLIFCGLLAGRRWIAAAVCLGLLVAARTTMIAIVPVFVLSLAASGALSLRALLSLGLAAGLPFLPFVLRDPGSVWYAMFGVYMKLMKGYVWHSTRWAIDTYGVTGFLLERGLERYVEMTQVAALAVTYVLAWRSIRRGGRPEPWMGLALLVFSMTTLWPVIYLYFDVWVLLACALLAYDGFGAAAARPAIRSTVAACGLSLAIVLAAGALRPGSTYRLDIGDPASAGYTGGGFGTDEAGVDEGRTAVWIEGETARVRLPRAGFTGATIRLAIRPQAGLDQRVAASINGHAIGMARLSDQWQEVTFSAPARVWNYGFNVLDLTFSYARPSDRPDGDRRALSAAIDRIVIE